MNLINSLAILPNLNIVRGSWDSTIKIWQSESPYGCIANLTDEEHLALKALSQDKTIVISKADKGNAVVIQDMETYRSKILELLQQDGKFNKINSDETVKRERRLQNYLRSLKNLDDTDYKRILPCGSRAGVMYRLPIHIHISYKHTYLISHTYTNICILIFILPWGCQFDPL